MTAFAPPTVATIEHSRHQEDPNLLVDKLLQSSANRGTHDEQSVIMMEKYLNAALPQVVDLDDKRYDEDDASKRTPSGEEQLWETAVASGFDLRGAIGKKWAAAKKSDGQLAGEYSKLKGYDAQRSFRAEWARQQLKQVQQRWAKKETSSTSDKVRGSYEPFGRIVEKEGSKYGAYEAACEWVRNCLAFHRRGEVAHPGKPWIVYNKMTKRAEFWYTKSFHEQSHKEEHETTTEFNPAAHEADTDAGGQQVDTLSTTTPPPKKTRTGPASVKSRDTAPKATKKKR